MNARTEIPARIGASGSGSPRGAAAREQIALIRSLVDEIERYASADPQVVSLGEQLEDEVARLLAVLRSREPEGAITGTLGKPVDGARRPPRAGS